MAEEVGIEALEGGVLGGETAREPKAQQISGPKIEAGPDLFGKVAAERGVRIQLVIETKTDLDKRQCDQVITGLNKMLRSASVKVGFLDEI
ncbi:MAG: hypothetical protein M0Z41_05650 [Peptococcaceae bacterium]|nr:hypothetical protein [Peptococcaceae bacterium]